MATHIELSIQIPRGAEAISFAKQLRACVNYYKDQVNILAAMISGSSSLAASYLPIATFYGIQGADDTAKGVAAKLYYDELNSAYGNAISQASLSQFLAEVG